MKMGGVLYAQHVVVTINHDYDSVSSKDRVILASSVIFDI